MRAQDYAPDNQPRSERADKTRPRGSTRNKADEVSILQFALRDPGRTIAGNAENWGHTEQNGLSPHVTVSAVRPCSCSR